jgi:AcrR family transcriptional regulator
VTEIFADKDFYGTTTSALAEAAGVSDALLFKHFPNKKSLYSAILVNGATKPAFEEFRQIMILPPSTSTLIKLIHYLVAHFVKGSGTKKGTAGRLMMHSFMEDGEFARLALKSFFEGWIGKREECLKVCSQSRRT